MNDWANTTYAVLGLGRSGLAAAKFLGERGARVIAMDRRAIDELHDVREALANYAVEYHCGEHSAAVLCSADVVVVSPGVSLDLPVLEPVRAAGIPIIGEIELALPFIQAPIVAVTGTNGKSTVTCLLGDVFARAGYRVVVGGNLGTPVLDLLADIAEADFVVLEVSSYQIEIAPSLMPETTVLLNVTPDHLDRYGDFASYAAAKQLLTDRLLPGQRLVYNGQDITVQQMIRKNCAQLHDFSSRDVRAIVGHAPQLSGVHNRENIAAVMQVAELYDVSPAIVGSVVSSFPGLPHRSQLVAEQHGVRFINDSKGTNVAAAAKSLSGCAAPVVWIAGGQDKGASYHMLAPIVRDHVKAMVLLGEAAPQLEQELGEFAPTYRVKDMEEAVAQARICAESGDVVLLSPACASFDMYASYADRGVHFQQCVEREGVAHAS